MLGTMLDLYILKGKEAMKTSNFQKYLRGTTACMKRVAIAAKGCGQLTSNDTYCADNWFSTSSSLSSNKSYDLPIFVLVHNVQE